MVDQVERISKFSFYVYKNRLWVIDQLLLNPKVLVMNRQRYSGPFIVTVNFNVLVELLSVNQIHFCDFSRDIIVGKTLTVKHS